MKQHDQHHDGRPNHGRGVAVRVSLGVAALTLALTAFAAPASAAPATAQVVQHLAARTCTAGTYQVVRGDSWIGIAKKVGVRTRKLLAANTATARTMIHPGRTICLPAGGSAPAAAAPSPAAAPPANQSASPKPPTTTPPAPAIVQRTHTTAEVEAIIRQVWPDELEDEALRIAIRESNLNPTAKNSCCWGLFQLYFNVHKSWLSGIGVTSASQLFDPTVNTNAALALYNRAGGWGPWR